MSRVLQCHSEGDKRFSALYAVVEVFGKVDVIENIYQLAKRDGDYVPENRYSLRGKDPTHYHIGGIDIPKEFGKAFYDLMWWKYFQQNKDLAVYASRFDDFYDRFRRTGSNVCQEDSIRDYIKLGKSGMLEKHKEFLDFLSENNIKY